MPLIGGRGSRIITRILVFHVNRTLRYLARPIVIAWLALIAAVPGAIAAETCVSGDFDGDGYGDRAVLDRHEPSVVRVWLSKSRRVHVMRARVTLSAIAARDLNGDRRAELVAREAKASLHVWTLGRSGFRAFGPREARVHVLPVPPRHHVDDRRASGGPLVSTSGPDAPATPPATRPGMAAPADSCGTLRPAIVLAAGRGASPSRPRSPPPHVV